MEKAQLKPHYSKLMLFDSLRQDKFAFTSLEPGKVKMYVCGPTVYDLLHVGNFRGPVVYNLVRNWLTVLGYQVEFVYNFTDVDDKIINRAKELGEEPDHLAERYIKEFFSDFHSLKLAPHSVNPKVSETMGEIIEMIEELIQKGAAYATPSASSDSQDVWYRVKSFKDYGKLSKRQTDQLRSGVRIESDERKEDPLDFALWKSAKPDERAWPSPWGKGRPGWHIECSAMSKKFLGEEIDIHGGGLDLLFPHHENEIAQSEGCHNKSFVRYWLHNNMIQFDGAKMSKSLGNVVKFRDFRLRYPTEVFKFLMLSSHYRSVVDFSDATIAQAIQGLAKIYSGLKLADQVLQTAKESPHFQRQFQGQFQGQFQEKLQEMVSVSSNSNLNPAEAILVLGQPTVEALNDDFNTPIVMREIFEALGAWNQAAQAILKNPVKLPQLLTEELVRKAYQFAQYIRQVGQLMALFQDSPQSFLEELDDALLKLKGLDREKIESLVQERKTFRDRKEFSQADAIRKILDEMGVTVHDYAVENNLRSWELKK